MKAGDVTQGTIRTPLRPLARILRARERGENPDAIERENIRLRHEAMRDRARQRAEGRLMVLAIFFTLAFMAVGGRMTILAASDPHEPEVSDRLAPITARRADIVDRHGRVLATNLVTHSLYAQPPLMTDPERAARELARIFPDLDEERLLRRFTGRAKFLWIRRKISPEQMQAVHDIGDPGLLFGPREMRLYPNGRLAAHVLGGAGFGREDVSSAEVVGVAGVEKAFDDYLRDPANGGAPLRLSIDLPIQSVVERVLEGGMRLMKAKGAAAVLMEAKTGEIVAMASLPDFDPNARPAPPVSGSPADSPLFNRAVQGVYELGSTFKLFTAAQAMELGLARPDTIIDATAPLKWGKFTIGEFRNHNYGKIPLADVIVKSSNVGTARLAMEIGADRQRVFLERLGLLESTPVELVEAPGARPLVPERWSEITTITVSYGHGLAASPLHLAAAYASLLNGGRRVTPTLLHRDTPPEPGPRIVSEEVSAAARAMLRDVVVRGTAQLAEVPGYAVAGKTGTADKPSERGYAEDKTITTFAGVFPAHDPAYVIVVVLDEPVDTTGPEPRRTAGWTAVPVAAEIIRRAAPLLGVPPVIEPRPTDRLTLTSN
ncbi:cell division protein FtsI (penicillin-binding protein 3) [Meinhardsimonia xiamenensis]|jgi:cell division protein FtsI (penicillin-binding protein 3)|uniref:Cell division protein FtsI (Penicillin-binding protein 3) n=1 Tax=Meinhardsimonia xiamenensis TaxID=990712 RepID=A0A1G9BAK4_9RHOB|nr:penicillin-binding protein 2 [Meinhardsimonia xiamenensis]PRX35069.1 cell division protein FtsI (penicillin-binding protein 3) [Meinhardsimonia xiamenensis]SDK36104.1 cell division protein FtsI (penicillin-binding protein 3) [Meinhardsimonia xiamenensis]